MMASTKRESKEDRSQGRRIAEEVLGKAEEEKRR